MLWASLLTVNEYSVRDIENFGQLKKETYQQDRFSIKKNEMFLDKVEKSKFAQINDKRYYFEDGIASLLFSHPFLTEIVNYKRKKKQKKKAGFAWKKRTY